MVQIYNNYFSFQTKTKTLTFFLQKTHQLSLMRSLPNNLIYENKITYLF
jgi:hypothetical protein